MGIEVQVLDRIDDVNEPEWNGVVAAAGAPVFYTHTFLSAYERFPLQPTHATYYLKVRATPGARLLAVLPAYLQETDDPAGDISSAAGAAHGTSGLMLLSHMNHCYDSHLPAVELTPQLISRVTGTLGELAAQAGADLFGFLHVEADGSLAQLLGAAGFNLVPMATRFRRDISGVAGIEDYISALPSQRARRTLRALRRVADQLPVRVLVSSGTAALAEVAGLCHRNAARHGTPDYYPLERMAGFLSRLGAALQVIEVRLDGALIAAGACLRDRKRFHLWACGLDGESHGRLSSPYTLLFCESVRAAIGSGCMVLEGGRGNYLFKTRYGLAPVPTLGAVAAP